MINITVRWRGRLLYAFRWRRSRSFSLAWDVAVLVPCALYVPLKIAAVHLGMVAHAEPWLALVAAACAVMAAADAAVPGERWRRLHTAAGVLLFLLGSVAALARVGP